MLLLLLLLFANRNMQYRRLKMFIAVCMKFDLLSESHLAEIDHGRVK